MHLSPDEILNQAVCLASAFGKCRRQASLRAFDRPRSGPCGPRCGPALTSEGKRFIQRGSFWMEVGVQDFGWKLEVLDGSSSTLMAHDISWMFMGSFTIHPAINRHRTRRPGWPSHRRPTFGCRFSQVSQFDEAWGGSAGPVRWSGREI